jgi:hypothetical protein
LSKVTRLQVDNKVRDRLLSEGKVGAISGFASSAMPSYFATGVKAHFMLFSDYGILNYGTTVMTQPACVADEPELYFAHEGDQRSEIANMVTNRFVGGLKLSPVE